jgi:opacity protein-like surface antigen
VGTLSPATICGSLVALSLLGPRVAFAQQTPEAPISFDLDDDDAHPGTPRPAGRDELTGRLVGSLAAGLASPSGAVARGVSVADVVTPGVGFDLTLGYGLSRHVVLEAAGSYALLGAPGETAAASGGDVPDDCASCSGSSLAVGLGLTYHLAEGLAVDPWIRYGLGYRSTSYDVSAERAALVLDQPSAAATTLTTRTFDLARIGLGVDFYPVPAIGFGPFLQIDAGTTFSGPEGTFAGAANALFQLGVRVAFRPGRPPARTTTAAR